MDGRKNARTQPYCNGKAGAALAPTAVRLLFSPSRYDGSIFLHQATTREVAPTKWLDRDQMISPEQTRLLSPAPHSFLIMADPEVFPLPEPCGIPHVSETIIHH